MVFFSNVKNSGCVEVSLLDDVSMKVRFVDDSSLHNIHVKAANQVNSKQLPWLPWIWYWTTTPALKALEVCDYLGERLAAFFGITTPKYQYEINEYLQMQNEGPDYDKASNVSEKNPLKINPKGDALQPNGHPKAVNQKNHRNTFQENLDWPQWINGIAFILSKAFRAICYLGELFAWLFGITTPAYWDETDEYVRVRKDKQLTWLQWIWYRTKGAGLKVFEICDDLGEWLAAFFGITTPKYQFEINEYIRMRIKEYYKSREKLVFTFLPIKNDLEGHQEKKKAKENIEFEFLPNKHDSDYKYSTRARLVPLSREDKTPKRN